MSNQKNYFFNLGELANALYIPNPLLKMIQVQTVR